MTIAVQVSVGGIPSTLGRRLMMEEKKTHVDFVKLVAIFVETGNAWVSFKDQTWQNRKLCLKQLLNIEIVFNLNLLKKYFVLSAK